MPWTFNDKEYDFTAPGFKKLILDIQSGAADMDAYNKLKEDGRVPEVNPMAFNRGVSVFGIVYATAHNGATWAMGEELGNDPWRGWEKSDWLPPVPPPRENLPDAA